MSRQATFLLQLFATASLMSLGSVSPLRCAAQTPDLGAGASLHGKPLFPPDNPWNQDISQMPVDPNSANLLASIGLNTGLHPDFGTVYNGAPNGIPYIVVPGSQTQVPVSFDYADESDPGPYPIPSNAPIEGGPNSSGDRHVLVIDRDNWILYELFGAYPSPDFSSWTAGSGAVFNLNSDLMRPEGWTSADAAGLPIFPGLVRYDEVYEQKAILHALRFTVQQTRRGFVYPARHFASSITDANYPPMGMRVRLKASFDISGFPASVQVILTALKKYGMMVADNGSNWFISGAPDSRWNDSELHTLSGVLGSDFEVVQMGDVTSDSLNPPGGLQASAGNATVSLSWTAVSGATGYNVKRAVQSGGPYTTLSPAAGTAGYTDTGLTNGQTYYYVVSARNAGVQSYDSTEVAATPAPSGALWQPLDVAVGSDNQARLLWNPQGGSVSVSSVNTSGTVTSSQAYGPYAGWTPARISAGTDGLTRVLWNNTNGAAALWLLNADNSYNSSFGYGPYAGWSATDVAAGTDGKTRLLWTNTDGHMLVWSVDNAGNPTSGPLAGPYAGWTAKALDAGNDGLTRVLWNNTNGAAALWLLNADNSYNSSFGYGPYTNWTAVDVAVGSDNKARVLWNNTDGQIALWSIDNAGTFTNNLAFGPLAGSTSKAIAGGADGLTRILWGRTDGTATLWLMNSDNTYNTSYGYGPY